MREVLRRVGPTSPHRREATSEVRTSFGPSCARVARRSHRGRPRSDPERPARPLSRRRRLRRERARPCERRRQLVPQPGRPPQLQERSPRARPDQQRNAGEFHRQHQVHPEQTPEYGRWHRVVDRLSEPQSRTRPAPSRHSPPPTLRRGGDQLRSMTAGTACQHFPTRPRRTIRVRGSLTSTGRLMRDVEGQREALMTA